MSDKYKSVLARFAKAFISGAVSAAGIITVANVHTWSDLYLSLNAIALLLLIGGINGILMAVEKFATWKEDGE